MKILLLITLLLFANSAFPADKITVKSRAGSIVTFFLKSNIDGDSYIKVDCQTMLFSFGNVNVNGYGANQYSWDGPFKISPDDDESLKTAIGQVCKK